MKIVAVTSCATGIAHSYMAAEALTKAVKGTEDEIKVEIQGAMGIENRLSKQEIADADLVIWAVDVGVRDKDRFEGKNVIQFGPYETIWDAKKTIIEAKEKAGL
ncbi:PTS fructose transporter subunit IIB [Pelolinea submarina]|uniref:PTS system IIB component (Fru family) n=1 Tax=Pelolinea submarina TaxID=913107 RepID=A0A347ZR51_9CHLR|nr:fructose PTS transporter subunit IIB [Pelolinea submarina]REG11664.1 PTS system IIB component (Fru family) [Pelolinea submarina]BBB47782.1 PTS system, fructose-specific IIB component [Pelolinea submarina]